MCSDGNVYWTDNRRNREDIKTTCNEKQICDETGVEPYCRDTTCVDEKGVERADTESWCVYDAYVGDSVDYVGSEHCRSYCHDGKVEQECSVMRDKICNETIDPVTHTSTAKLRPNLGKDCFSIDNIAECEDHLDCIVHNVYVDTHFKFDACVPKYPEGFDIKSDNLQENGKEVCAMANIPCIEIKDDDGWFRGKDDDVANGKCKTPIYVEEMHKFCVSIGDCGSYYNYVGNYTDGEDLREPVNYCNWFTKMMHPEYCEAWLDFLKSPDGPFSSTGGDFPKVINNIPNRERMYVTSFERINGVIAGEGEAQGKDYWEGVRGSEVDIMEKYYYFTCEPWQPPPGGDFCHKCNEGSTKCTDYKCQSLGSACVISEESKNTPRRICIDSMSGDGQPPTRSFGTISSQYTVSTGTYGVSISLNGGGCPEKRSSISFTILTNEDAICTTSTDASGVKQMIDGEREREFSTIHPINVLLGVDDNLRLFVNCTDLAGNHNTWDYLVDICVSPQADTTAPNILRYIPGSGSYIPFGETNKQITLRINEPAVCRQSRVPYTAFADMDYLCVAEDDGSLGPYLCSTSLSDLTSPRNDIYIKCSDVLNNAHATDQVYTLLQTREGLEVTITSPMANSIRRTPVSATNPFILEARTTKGADNNKANCKWRFVGQGWGADFKQTGETIHKQVFNSDALENGDYRVKVSCEDIFGNVAEAEVNFSINIDETPPNITSWSAVGNVLSLVTDEIAQCYYNNSNCSYDVTEGTRIPADVTGKRHTLTSFTNRTDYYIRCIDDWGNHRCALVIEATDRAETEAPGLTRIFYDKDSSKLKLITDEFAQCEYKTQGDTCEFTFGQGNAMTKLSPTRVIDGQTYSMEHTAPWFSNSQYKIRCRDSWGNEDCLAIVEAVKLVELGG